MIINATFTSVWDSDFAVTTNCKVNTETREIFDIQASDNTADAVNCLEYEFVTINGKKYNAVNKENEEVETGDYWYGED